MRELVSPMDTKDSVHCRSWQTCTGTRLTPLVNAKESPGSLDVSSNTSKESELDWFSDDKWLAEPGTRFSLVSPVDRQDAIQSQPQDRNVSRFQRTMTLWDKVMKHTPQAAARGGRENTIQTTASDFPSATGEQQGFIKMIFPKNRKAHVFTLPPHPPAKPDASQNSLHYGEYSSSLSEDALHRYKQEDGPCYCDISGEPRTVSDDHDESSSLSSFTAFFRKRKRYKLRATGLGTRLRSPKRILFPQFSATKRTAEGPRQTPRRRQSAEFRRTLPTDSQKQDFRDVARRCEAVRHVPTNGTEPPKDRFWVSGSGSFPAVVESSQTIGGGAPSGTLMTTPFLDTFQQRLQRPRKRFRTRLQRKWSLLQRRGTTDKAFFDNYPLETIAASLKRHTLRHGDAPVNMAPMFSEEQFLLLARDFGLDAPAINRWCCQGVECWITFEFPRTVVYHNLRNALPLPLSSPPPPAPLQCGTPTASGEGFTPSVDRTPTPRSRADATRSPRLPSCATDACPSPPARGPATTPSSPTKTLTSNFKSVQLSPAKATRPQPLVDTPQVSALHVSASPETNFMTHTLSAYEHTLEAYHMSRIVPGGARLWDESGICWLSRRYTLFVSSATGKVMLSKQLPRNTRHRRRASTVSTHSSLILRHDKDAIVEHKTTTSSRNDSWAKGSLSQDQLVTYPGVLKALCLGQLESASRLCYMNATTPPWRSVVGALRCVRMARAAAQHNEGRRPVINPPTSRHHRRFLLKLRLKRNLIWGLLGRGIIWRRSARTHLQNHPSFSDDSITTATTTTTTTTALPSGSPIAAPMRSFIGTPSKQPSIGNQSRFRQPNSHHATRDDDLMREFGYTSVGMFFRHKQKPLIAVFDESSEASEFIRMLSLLLYVMEPRT